MKNLRNLLQGALNLIPTEIFLERKRDIGVTDVAKKSGLIAKFVIETKDQIIEKVRATHLMESPMNVIGNPNMLPSVSNIVRNHISESDFGVSSIDKQKLLPLIGPGIKTTFAFFNAVCGETYFTITPDQLADKREVATKASHIIAQYPAPLSIPIRDRMLKMPFDGIVNGDVSEKFVHEVLEDEYPESIREAVHEATDYLLQVGAIDPTIQIVSSVDSQSPMVQLSYSPLDVIKGLNCFDARKSPRYCAAREHVKEVSGTFFDIFADIRNMAYRSIAGDSGFISREEIFSIFKKHEKQIRSGL